MRLVIHTGTLPMPKGSVAFHLVSHVVELLVASGAFGKILEIGVQPYHQNHASLEYQTLREPRGIAGLSTWLYRKKLEKSIEKFSPSVVLNFDSAILPTCPQPVVQVLLPDMVPGSQSFFSGRKRQGRRSLQLVQQATTLVVGTAVQQTVLAKKFGIEAKKVTVCGTVSLPSFAPLPWAAREQVKEKLTNSAEYFLSYNPSLSDADLMHLLKAFSAFKKRQHSSMHLVIAVGNSINEPKLRQKLDTYKYRSEVKLLENVPLAQLAEAAAAAYTILATQNHCPDWWLHGCTMVGQAVVALETENHLAVLADAGLYLENDKADSLAKAMMQVYKEEHLRSAMAELALQQAEKGGWQSFFNLLLLQLEKAAAKA